MSHRTLEYASAMICLVGSLLVAFMTLSADAADECLSGPKGNTPTGRHWYYRIDRPTKKHCWYLGEEGARASKTASSKPVEAVAAATADEGQLSSPLEPSVANARAEFAPMTATASASPQSVQPSESAPDAATPGEDTRRLTERDLITQPPVTLASRWPLPNEFQPTEPQADPALHETSQNSVDLPKQQQPEQNAGSRIGPLQIFLCVLAIALALTAIIGRAIFQLAANTRRKEISHIRRRPIWPDEMPLGAVRPSYAQMVTPERRARAMRPDRDVTDEIERLLRGVSRRQG